MQRVEERGLVEQDVEGDADLITLADAAHEQRICEIPLVEVDGRVLEPEPEPCRGLEGVDQQGALAAYSMHLAVYVLSTT